MHCSNDSVVLFRTELVLNKYIKILCTKTVICYEVSFCSVYTMSVV